MKRKLIIEESEGVLWGRTFEDDDLIVGEADSMQTLIIQMKELLFSFHQIEPQTVDFEIEYDLTAFFDRFNYLKLNKVAEVAGMNYSLLKQYVNKKKYPSESQTKRIEKAIHQIASQLYEVRLHVA